MLLHYKYRACLDTSYCLWRPSRKMFLQVHIWCILSPSFISVDGTFICVSMYMFLLIERARIKSPNAYYPREQILCPSSPFNVHSMLHMLCIIYIYLAYVQSTQAYDSWGAILNIYNTSTYIHIQHMHTCICMDRLVYMASLFFIQWVCPAAPTSSISFTLS